MSRAHLDTKGAAEAECDVAVVGAGPAGSAAAIALARSGRRVILIDKALFPRDKCCGDGLTIGALRHLSALGLQPEVVNSWCPVRTCWVRSPSGRTVELPLPEEGTYVAVAKRLELDHALVRLAEASGAEVRLGDAVVGAGADGSGRWVRLETASGEVVRARFVLGADGAWSPLRKVLLGRSQESYLGDWHAFRRYFEVSGPLARDLWVWFEPELLPGYAWSFPVGENLANVGFGMLRRPGLKAADMARAWQWLTERPHVARVLGEASRPVSPQRAWPIPARLSGRPLSALGGRALFIGDAASDADPMTGEGIGQALETAAEAATAIMAAGPEEPDRAAEIYRRSVRDGLGLDNWLSKVMRAPLVHPLGARGAVLVAGGGARRRQRFVRWMFEDYPRAIVLTPWRWRRGTMTSPPPFGSELPSRG